MIEADPTVKYVSKSLYATRSWNVTGRMFNTLHLMFMEQYTEMWTAVDPFAERIRALGYPAPGSYSAFTRLSSIAEETESPNALAMVANLVKA